jgi:hypothetical protein
MEMKAPHEAHLRHRITAEPLDRSTPHRWNCNWRRSATEVDDAVTRVTLTFVPVAESSRPAAGHVLSVGRSRPGLWAPAAL